MLPSEVTHLPRDSIADKTAEQNLLGNSASLLKLYLLGENSKSCFFCGDPLTDPIRSLINYATADILTQLTNYRASE